MSPAATPSDLLVDQLRTVVDRALLDMLTASPGTALQRAQPSLHRAIALLRAGARHHITDEAASAIQDAYEALNTAKWDEARCMLVTARGRLARPDCRYTG